MAMPEATIMGVQKTKKPASASFGESAGTSPRIVPQALRRHPRAARRRLGFFGWNQQLGALLGDAGAGLLGPGHGCPAGFRHGVAARIALKLVERLEPRGVVGALHELVAADRGERAHHGRLGLPLGERSEERRGGERGGAWRTA